MCSAFVTRLHECPAASETNSSGDLRAPSPPSGGAEVRMAEAFVFGVSAKRLAQRFVSGAWLCRMY